MRNVATVIMAGGQGARLYPLTRDRAKPSVTFAGKYRLIDIPMSNCIHSEVRLIYILTQFNSQSLNRHIVETYQFGSMGRVDVQILAASQTLDTCDWYQGTADAVRQNLRHLIRPQWQPREFLVLAGDHLYRMDYRKFVDRHRETDADITIATIPVPQHEASRFGVLQVNSRGWITRFVEKPDKPEDFEGLVLPSTSADAGPVCLASMGIYVIKGDVLPRILRDNKGVDFGHDIIPAAIDDYKVQSYVYDGYWEDIGTIGAFFDANMALLETVPRFDFYNEWEPIYTHRYHLPNTKVNQSEIVASMLGDGGIIDSSYIERSIVGLRAIIRGDTHIENSLLMGADYYESAEQIAQNADAGNPPVGIGEGCHIKHAIIDKNARVGEGCVLINENNTEHADAEDGSWYIRDGIVVVPKNGVIPPGTRI